MPDRDEVMQWLETCVSGCEDGCPYEYKHLVYRVECKADLMRDALALLKEQEAVEPIDLGLSTDFIVWGCPICERRLERDYKYCPFCGRAVKWDD